MSRENLAGWDDAGREPSLDHEAYSHQSWGGQGEWHAGGYKDSRRAGLIGGGSTTDSWSVLSLD